MVGCFAWHHNLTSIAFFHLERDLCSKHFKKFHARQKAVNRAITQVIFAASNHSVASSAEDLSRGHVCPLIAVAETASGVIVNPFPGYDLVDGQIKWSPWDREKGLEPRDIRSMGCRTDSFPTFHAANLLGALFADKLAP